MQKTVGRLDYGVNYEELLRFFLSGSRNVRELVELVALSDHLPAFEALVLLKFLFLNFDSHFSPKHIKNKFEKTVATHIGKIHSQNSRKQ